MYTSIHTSLLLLLPLSFALPQTTSPSTYGTFIPPTPNDSRSPCPALNTLANHGLLPRNGLNISLAALTTAIDTAYNFHSDFASLVGGLAISIHSPQDGTFDLYDVDMHNYPIEQDNSFSRQDAYFGNQTVFNQTVFNQTTAVWGSAGYTSSKLVGDAHYVRVKDSKARNPQWLYGARQYVTSYIRDATGIAAMSDPYSGNASIAWYKYWIENERLPVDLGWNRPTQANTLVTLSALAAKIAATQPQDIAPIAITLATVKDAFSLGSILNSTLL